MVIFVKLLLPLARSYLREFVNVLLRVCLKYFEIPSPLQLINLIKIETNRFIILSSSPLYISTILASFDTHTTKVRQFIYLRRDPQLYVTGLTHGSRRNSMLREVVFFLFLIRHRSADAHHHLRRSRRVRSDNLPQFNK